MKLMPESPDSDLARIQEQAKQTIEELKGQVINTEQEPIAFGLKAIIITFSIDETTDQDPFLEALEKIEEVSSAQIIDFRREFG